MPNAEKQSKYVQIPRAVAMELLKAAQQIAATDKSAHLADSGSAYAHALGTCNGTARAIARELEHYLNA